MELPKITEIQNNLSLIIKNLKSLIESFTVKDDLSQEEYNTQLDSIINGLGKLLIKMKGVDHPNSKINKQSSNAYKEVCKIFKKLKLGTSNIEMKYQNDKLNRFFSWENIYKTTKMRNDILAHLKGVLKDLRKIQKKI